MSVPKFKRRPSGLDYVDNAFELQKDIMNLASKLSARWARIYQQPIDRSGSYSTKTGRFYYKKMAYYDV